MDLLRLQRMSASEWRLEPQGAMLVPAVLYGSEPLIAEMGDKVLEQIGNVACLPGIVDAAYTMPDAHWGYGFPIGGVAAFDPGEGGVVSAGGVGFDISCGVRTLLTGLKRSDLEHCKESLADSLFRSIPAGLGSTGAITLDAIEMDRMLEGGARWAVAQGYGRAEDLDRIEEGGQMPDAEPDAVSERARHRQREEMGTLGSGNHYLEVQEVTTISDEEIAAEFGLARGDIVVAIHCGSRGLGHQIGTDFLREMALAAPAHGIALPDLELACAPLRSELGERYLGAMRRHQLRSRQPSDIDPPDAPGLRAFLPRGDPAGAVRRVAQHLQGGGARDCRQAAPPVRASQGRDAGVRRRPPRPAGGLRDHRTTSVHRRQHGDDVGDHGRAGTAS